MKTPAIPPGEGAPPRKSYPLLQMLVAILGGLVAMLAVVWWKLPDLAEPQLKQAAERAGGKLDLDIRAIGLAGSAVDQIRLEGPVPGLVVEIGAVEAFYDLPELAGQRGLRGLMIATPRVLIERKRLPELLAWALQPGEAPVWPRNPAEIPLRSLEMEDGEVRVWDPAGDVFLDLRADFARDEETAAAHLEWSTPAGQWTGQARAEWTTDRVHPVQGRLEWKVEDPLQLWSAAEPEWASRLPAGLELKAGRMQLEVEGKLEPRTGRNELGLVASWLDLEGTTADGWMARLGGLALAGSVQDGDPQTAQGRVHLKVERVAGPGVETGPFVLEAVVAADGATRVELGPWQARFPGGEVEGKAELTLDDPRAGKPSRAALAVEFPAFRHEEGEAGVEGSGRLSAELQLDPEQAGRVLAYTGTAGLEFRGQAAGGKVAGALRVEAAGKDTGPPERLRLVVESGEGAFPAGEGTWQTQFTAGAQWQRESGGVQVETEAHLLGLENRQMGVFLPEVSLEAQGEHPDWAAVIACLAPPGPDGQTEEGGEKAEPEAPPAGAEGATAALWEGFAGRVQAGVPEWRYGPDLKGSGVKVNLMKTAAGVGRAGGKWEGEVGLEKVRVGKIDLSEVTLQAELSAEEAAARVAARVGGTGQVELQVMAQPADMPGRPGVWDFTVRIPPSQFTGITLMGLLDPGLKGLGLDARVSGSIQGLVDPAKPEAVEGGGQLEISGLTVRWPEQDLNLTEGLARVNISSLSPLGTPSRQRLELKSLTKGAMEIRNLAVQFQVLSEHEIVIESISADLLGGSVVTSGFLLDLNQPEVNLGLEVRNIDLAQVKALLPDFKGDMGGKVRGWMGVDWSPGAIGFQESYLELVPNTGGFLKIPLGKPLPPEVAAGDPKALLQLDGLQIAQGSVQDMVLSDARMDLFRRKTPGNPNVIHLAGQTRALPGNPPVDLTVNPKGDVEEAILLVLREVLGLEAKKK